MGALFDGAAVAGRLGGAATGRDVGYEDVVAGRGVEGARVGDATGRGVGLDGAATGRGVGLDVLYAGREVGLVGAREGVAVGREDGDAARDEVLPPLGARVDDAVDVDGLLLDPPRRSDPNAGSASRIARITRCLGVARMAWLRGQLGLKMDRGPRDPSERLLARIVPLFPSARCHVLTLLVATACAPGEIRWAAGADDLRTALFVTDTDRGFDHAILFLSTGIFPCGLPSDPDPQVQTETLAALTVGACREDARHLVVELYKAPGLDWSERYPFADVEPPPPGTERGSLARYVGIDEAAALRREGLVPIYFPTALTRYDALGEPGAATVRTLRDDTLSGSVDLPAASVRATFTATRCTDARSLFDLIVASPIASCTLTPDE